MTTVAQIQGMFNPPGATTTKQSTDSVADAQDRFLKLLVTQMQNQDPLNPMDNSQVTTQLAQLDTVTGIQKLNQTLSQMATSSSAQQSLQAAMLVGRGVLIAGNTVNFSGQAVRFGIDLPQAVDNVTVSIADAKGNVVDRFQTGAQFQGSTTFQWDGTDSAGNALPNGTYTVSATATASGTSVTATPLSATTVQSVGAAADGSIKLQLASGGAVGVGDIKRFM